MRLRLFFLLFLTVTIAHAQESGPLEGLVKSCEDFAEVSRPDSVRKYALLARDLAIRENNPIALAKAEVYLGNGLMRSNPDSAYRLIKRSYDDFRQRNNIRYLVTASNALGNYYAQRDNKPEALRYYLQGKQFVEQYYSVNETSRYPRKMAALHHNISTIYNDMADYKQAQEYSLIALRLATQHNLKEVETAAVNQMGKMMLELRQFEQAEIYFRQSLQMATAQNSPQRRGVALNNLGSIFLLRYVNDSLRAPAIREKDYQLASTHFREALAIAKELNDLPSISFRLNGLSNLAIAKKDYQTSKTYLLEALNYAETSRSQSAKIKALANLALNYVKTDEVPLAIQTANEAIALTKQIDSPEILPKLYNTLQQAYWKQQEYQKALDAQKAANLAMHSLYETTTTNEVQELQTRYETEKKQRAIALLSAQNRVKTAELRQQQAELQQKNYQMMALSAVALLLLGGAFLFVRQRTLQQRQQAAEMKQRLLRAQLNPHFLFNSLNSIQRLYVEGRMSQANDFIADFAQLMRDILEKTGRTTIPLYEEIEFIEAYLSLEKRRLGDKFDYEVVMSDELRHSDIEVPSFIVQPLAENALMHGVLPSNRKGNIRVLVEQKSDDRVSISVQDDGVGFYKSMQQVGKHKSRGMELIQTRLGRRGKMLIEELKDLNQAILGTKVELQLTI